MVRNDETGNANFLADNEHQIIRAGARLGVIVGGNHSACGHAPEWIHHVERGLQMLSAYVLKVDINPLRSCLSQCLGELPAGLVVNRSVYATMRFQPFCFFVTPHAANDAAAQLLRDLADNCTDRA